MVIGESFRLSRKTDGFFLPGPGTIKKQKRDGPAIGKPTYRPPAPPKTEIESAVKRPLLCTIFLAEPLGIKNQHPVRDALYV
jgi:hypothetical protein